MKRKIFLRVFLIIIWLIVIFMFSNQNANSSLDLSKKVIYKIVSVLESRELTAEEKANLAKKYIVIVRKSAHFFLYFTLSILVFIFIKEIIRNNFLLLMIPITFCFVYAISDEYHQSMVSGRTARVFDVCVDTSGAILGDCCLFILHKIKLNKTNK